MIIQGGEIVTPKNRITLAREREVYIYRYEGEAKGIRYIYNKCSIDEMG